ncbi:MAG TPA: ABC transporter ATP-binding protein [Actinomycetota bacterium]|nr:ABC transporter ATP-binding protein [Actinomycetota bacterium]
MSLLEVETIDVYYGSVQALRGLSMRVEEGEMVALVGANGAGKTTTLRTVSGLIAPRSGSIKFEGQEIGGIPAHKLVSRGIAHLPEGRDLFPTLSVEENLRYGYWSRRKQKEKYSARLEQMFAYFPKLKERRKQASGTLSGGEQQMLGVARALMSSPKLFLVDELSLGLAPIIVTQLFEILKDANREGTTIVLVEQFVHMALGNTQRAYVLAKGEVVMENSSQALLDDPMLVASYLGEADLEAAYEESHPEAVPGQQDGSDDRPAPRKTSSRASSAATKTKKPVAKARKTVTKKSQGR